jgi:hypothetical protein
VFRLSRDRADQRRQVGFREIIALEQQGRIHRLGERVGGAVGKIELCLRIHLFAVALESGNGLARLRLVEGNDFEIIVALQKAPHAAKRRDAMARPQNDPRLMHVDG